MKLPTTGKVRIWMLNGRVTEFRPATEVEILPDWIHCQGDTAGEACLVIPAVSVQSIEYATDGEAAAEVKRMKERALKPKAGGKN
jgi:hypothetical protein